MLCYLWVRVLVGFMHIESLYTSVYTHVGLHIICYCSAIVRYSVLNQGR